MTNHTAASLREAQAETMRSMFQPAFMKPAILESFKRLAPQVQWKNPVMFVCYIGAILTTGLGIQAIVGQGEAPPAYILSVSLWLWFTVLFANFAEAIAEGAAGRRPRRCAQRGATPRRRN
jgi:K+-transporting ATPase ATPase B chain